MAVANQTPASVASDYATIQFIVQQLTNGMATAALVRIMGCTNDGGLVPVGTVDVSLLVDMVNAEGQTFSHGTIFKVPYSRIQGGANAIILDPQPGDIGVCVFASRDSSSVKANPAAAADRKPQPGAPPGSARVFSLSDALYIGGMLNGIPTQFVQFNAEGITIKSPTAVVIEAPTIELKGNVAQTDGDVTMSQALDVQGIIHSATDVVADTISEKNHIHPPGTPPNTGPPIP